MGFQPPNFGSGVRSRVAGGGEHCRLSVWALVSVDCVWTVDDISAVWSRVCRVDRLLPALVADGCSPRQSLLGLEVRNAGLVKSRESCGLMTLWRARLAKEHQAQTLVLMVRIGMTPSFYMMAVISGDEELAVHPTRKCRI